MEDSIANVLLNSTPLACRIWDKDFKIIYMNDEAVNLFGAESKQTLMDNYFALSPEYQPDGKKSREKTFEILKKAVEEGRCVFEWMHQKLDGTPLPTEITLVRVSYGDAYAVAGYTRDLREQKKMVEEIGQRDKLLSAGYTAIQKLLTTQDDTDFEAALLESLQIVGRATDTDRVFIWKNHTLNGKLYCTQLYEWTEGGDCYQGSAYTVDISYDNNIPGWEKTFSRGQCVNGIVRDMSPEEQAQLSPQGILSILAVPIFLQDEFWGFMGFNDCRVERIFTVNEEITLRAVSLMIVSALNRNMQAAKILEAHGRTKLLLDSMPLSCRLWNREYRIFDYNEESLRLFHVNDGQELIERYFDLSPEYQPDGHLSKERAVEVIQKAFDEGRYVFEWMNQTLDGILIPTEITLVRVDYEGDYVVAGYTRDLREHKKMMREIAETSEKLEIALKDAQRANSTKSDFLANISHEMRTPLNAVIGLSGLLLDTAGLDEDVRVNLKKIYSAGSTLLGTVNDILDISKIEAGKMELVTVDYDVPSLINDTVTQNVLRIGERPVELRIDIKEDMLSRLHGDELRIKQIINNLLSNAIKYTKEGTVEMRVRHHLAEDAVWLSIEVQDTGIGIRTEDMDRLFTEYTQVDTKANRKIEGTGLGLPLIKKLAEMMNGSITVKSEYGKGSIFTVMLMQKYVTDVKIGIEVVESLKTFHYFDKRNQTTQFTRISLPYARVLIVDDNITNLDVAKGLMKPYGMQIDCVTDGQQAIDAILSEEARYNAIFMDHMMPGMDGLEATRRIRKIGTDYAKQIPVIALTANAILGNEKMFLENGFQAFLSKPIDVVRLDEAIRHWIRDKEQEKLYPEWQSGPDENKTDGLLLRIPGDLPAGLDIKKGLDRFGGDESTYMHVLRSFAVNTRRLLASIKDVGRDDLPEYAITVHGIKGSSRGICAETAGNMAEALEQAANAGDFDSVSGKNPVFIETVGKLIAYIEDMLEKSNEEHPKPKKERPDSGLLEKLLKACREYDMDGVDDVMAELELYEYAVDGGMVEWLREQVENTDFKRIIEKLSGYQV